MDCWRMKFERTRASGARPARATPRWVSIPIKHAPLPSAFHSRAICEGVWEVLRTDDLLLVTAQLLRVPLCQTGPVSKVLLSHSITGDNTFRATSTACVLLTNPTATEPCFIASRAYSTWKIRPCGELLSRLLVGVSSSQRIMEEGYYKVTESLS
jgi:hypothetical protein